MLFASSQAVQKRWAKLGLMVTRKRTKKSYVDLKDCLLALPFAPKDDIPHVLVEIEEDLPLALCRERKVKDMFKYMRTTWIDGEYKSSNGPLQRAG